MRFFGLVIKRDLLSAAGLGLLLTLGASQVSWAENPACQDSLTCPSSWTSLKKGEKTKVFTFAEDYKAFIHKARTELSFVEQAVDYARKQGFSRLKDSSPLTPGARYYDINRARALSLIVIGSEPFSHGFHVVGSHIDSPRLELKGRPLYEDGEFALFQTNFHGGIKPYQWTNIPLALMGRVDRKDGSIVKINVGLEPADPVFMIADLSPHVDRGYKDKKVKDQIKYEDLDPVIGHIPHAATGNGVMQQVIGYLKDTYNITPADLVSAELALVPANAPRDVGFDRGLVAAYGQDDRLSAYAALRAIVEIKIPAKTVISHFVDNEEVGNRNNTGARSDYFSDLLSRLLYARKGEKYREPMLREALKKSRMVSVDVNPGINPKNPSAWELGNAPKLGHGVNIKLYGQGNAGNSETLAWIRKNLDDKAIPWQTSTYKVGRAGGGTIGGEYSRQNMEVVDYGVPLLSIHTPYSISSKVDIYTLYRALRAFLDN